MGSAFPSGLEFAMVEWTDRQTSRQKQSASPSMVRDLTTQEDAVTD